MFIILEISDSGHKKKTSAGKELGRLMWQLRKTLSKSFIVQLLSIMPDHMVLAINRLVLAIEMSISPGLK